jgi:pilus assembly protein Flp/PilA
MRRLRQLLLELLRDEEGPTAVEYAVMLALIIIVCFAAISTIGTASRDNFNSPKIGSALQSGS